MEPIFGFMLFAVAVIVVAVVARKRGQAAWPYVVGSVVAGFALAVVVGRIGGGTAAGLAAFLAPVAAVFISLSRSTSEAAAIAQGEHGAFRKCPFCAEAIRREAIKCKHCGSEVPAAPIA